MRFEASPPWSSAGDTTVTFTKAGRGLPDFGEWACRMMSVYSTRAGTNGRNRFGKTPSGRDVSLPHPGDPRCLIISLSSTPPPPTRQTSRTHEQHVTGVSRGPSVWSLVRWESYEPDRHGSRAIEIFHCQSGKRYRCRRTFTIQHHALLLHHHSAVDHDRLSGDVVGVARREECGWAGNVLRGRGPA